MRAKTCFRFHSVQFTGLLRLFIKTGAGRNLFLPQKSLVFYAIICYNNNCYSAGVSELADDRDSKSCGEIRVGSSPTTGTKPI